MDVGGLSARGICTDLAFFIGCSAELGVEVPD